MRNGSSVRKPVSCVYIYIYIYAEVGELIRLSAESVPSDCVSEIPVDSSTCELQVST